MTFSFCHLYTLKIECFLSCHPLASPLYVYCPSYLIVSHYVLHNDMEPNMRIFKNAWFERFARKNRISDKALREVVELADKGLISADLGSGVIKQRLARRGGGKSGGYRTIIFYRVAEKAFSSMRTQRMREKILQPSRKMHFEKLRITFSILLMNNWRN